MPALPTKMSIFADYVQSAKLSGRPLISILAEALKLRLSPNQLGLSEYIDFQLYHDDLAYSEKLTFGGVRAQSILEEILIDDYSRILSLDKVTMYALMRGHGLPIPELRATYRSIRPSSTLSLQSAEDLEQYLTQPGALPVYIKRSFGSYGRGNTLLRAVEGNNFVLGNGALEPIPEFCRTLDEARTLGWMLQEPLASHAAIRDLTQSDKISGLRIHTFLCRQEATILKAIFKINVGVRDSDNFEHGASGNLLGAVDTATGKVFRVIAGTGLGQTCNPPHPFTGREIVGFQVPYWSALVNLVQDAHAAFPGFICPGWDIALCEGGPKILEVNAFGDIDLSQHAYRSGFLDEMFLSLMRGRTLEKLLRLSPKNWTRSNVNNRLGVRRHHWPW